MMELDSGNSKLSFFVAGVLVWAVREIGFAAKKTFVLMCKRTVYFLKRFKLD